MHIDQQKAARVWQRVQSRQAPAPQPQGLTLTPEGLVLEEMTDSLLFAQLAQQVKDGTALRTLSQQAAHRASILRGICVLSGLTAPGQIPKPSRQDNIPAALRRLMGRLLRRTEEYRKLCDHGEFGELYQGLVKLTRESALLLAQVIGK